MNMVIKGYIIEKYNHMLNAYTCNRLVQEAGFLGIDLQIVGVHDSFVKNGFIYNDGNILERRQFVINRYKHGHLKTAINELTEHSYNSLEQYNRYLNKYEQIKKLRSGDFIVPKYLLGTAALSYDIIASELGAPFVVKGLESSMGEEVILIKRKEDLQILIKQYGLEKEWLYEEFIKTSVGRDIRFYSIRGKVIACMQRTSQGDFRANVALGAEVTQYEITPAIRNISEDIYNETGLDFIGIDLLFGIEKPYFCEINVMPGIRGIEKASGVNVARKVIETIVEDFDNEQR